MLQSKKWDRLAASKHVMSDDGIAEVQNTNISASLPSMQEGQRKLEG